MQKVNLFDGSEKNGETAAVTTTLATANRKMSSEKLLFVTKYHPAVWDLENFLTKELKYQFRSSRGEMTKDSNKIKHDTDVLINNSELTIHELRCQCSPNSSNKGLVVIVYYHIASNPAFFSSVDVVFLWLLLETGLSW